MARFIGTIEDYEKYIGPRIRNIVNTFAKSERDSRNGKCEFCGQNTELESAHKHGKERNQLIKEALKKYDNGSYFDIDVEKCEQDILELHTPINAVFYFLCRKCHRSYDSNGKSEIPRYEQQPIEKQTEDGMVNKVDGIINIKGTNVPLYKNENEKTQDFIKRILHLFFKENLLPDVEIKNMLDKNYCKKTFGISYSILQNDKTKLRDKKDGPFRYWANEIFGNEYYACSQWWKTNDETYKKKLSEWIKKIEEINKI
jgi:hypothetical protein